MVKGKHMHQPICRCHQESPALSRRSCYTSVASLSSSLYPPPFWTKDRSLLAVALLLCGVVACLSCESIVCLLVSLSFTHTHTHTLYLPWKALSLLFLVYVLGFVGFDLCRDPLSHGVLSCLLSLSCFYGIFWTKLALSTLVVSCVCRVCR